MLLSPCSGLNWHLTWCSVAVHVFVDVTRVWERAREKHFGGGLHHGRSLSWVGHHHWHPWTEAWHNGWQMPPLRPPRYSNVNFCPGKICLIWGNGCNLFFFFLVQHYCKRRDLWFSWGVFWVRWPCLSIISKTLDLFEMGCTLTNKSSEQHGLLMVSCKATGALLPEKCKMDFPLSRLPQSLCVALDI